MVTSLTIISLIFAVSFLAVLLSHHIVLYRKSRNHCSSEQFEQAKSQFHWQRELVEARFVTYAMARLDSNLWIWDEAEFGSEVLIAHSKKEATIYAYLPVQVEMNRPIRRLDQPKNEFYYRQLTVIARYNPAACTWEMTGRAFFNQLPNEVVQERSRELQIVDTVKNRVA
jgi:hypothetical protein